MFIPNHFTVGQEVSSTEPLYVTDGHFTVGHTFTVANIVNVSSGLYEYDLVDSDGRKLFNVKQSQLKKYLSNYMDR